MASSRSPTLTQSSSQKKQQSISSFFGRKPLSTPAPRSSSPHASESPTAALHTEDPERGDEPQREEPSLTLDGDAPSIQKTKPRKLKRVAEEDGLGDRAPDPKRLRTVVEELNAEDGSATGRTALQEQHMPNGKRSTSGLQGSKKDTLSGRTSKYVFSSSPQLQGEEDTVQDEDLRRQREKLHQRFVKKLGRPDSIAEIKRRNHFITEETVQGEEDDAVDAEDLEPEPEPKASGRKGAAGRKGSSKLTPMEKQVLELKRKHMDTLLVVEVGYKFRFFGEDARIAAKELGIVCIPGKYRYDEHSSEAHLERFASASIPVHRLHVHVRRLVTAGHKVGVVRQLETAALKAVGDNRNAPFVRKLTNLYTKGTYIDDIEGLGGPTDGPSGGAPATGYLLCITETSAKGWGTDEKVHVGIVAVQPATGDVIYDDFEDGFMRSEIETRLLHIAPCEMLIVGNLSKATERLVQHLSGSKTNVFGDKVRVERIEKPKTMAAESYSHISNFYAGKMKASGDDPKASAMLDRVHKLSELVTICLSAMINHLTDYGLEHVFDLTKYFQSFSARAHMLLNGNTLTSLELYQNQTDHTAKGSLFWTLDRTKTRFGQRLLRKWVGRPLLDRAKLEERIAAVEELKDGERTIAIDKLKHLVRNIKSDLEKSIIRIYYKKCTRPELLGVLQTLQRIASEFAHIKNAADAGFSSEILNQAVASLPTIRDDVVSFLERINAQAARDDDKYAFFREEQETDEITEHKLAIASIEYELNEHRKDAAEKIRKKKVDYVTVAGIEYLIEVDNNQIKNIPASWAKISGTKKVSRFHTPEVVRMVRERDQHREALAAACDKAFIVLLTEISAKYQSFRDCIQALATLDCLLSLAEVASQPGYVKPTLTDETVVEVLQGRHPMVEQLLLDAYVPNDISLSAAGTRALLITGPNMGGKSSFVRQVALICILGQIGSYVPAASATLGMLDAVFTRMGAHDNMLKGESTFMVELSETSDMLKQATPRSLVLLDELGRGTSTHDGVAIASAVLEHVVRDVGALTLFITHYQELSGMARAFGRAELRNVHMRFEETGEGEGEKDVVFLYEVAPGVAHRSYGLNVAKAANVPRAVLEVAAVKSRELEESVRRKKMGGVVGCMGKVMGGEEEALDVLVRGIEQL